MSENCKNIFSLAMSFLGVILGLSSFFVFFCFYGNKDAGVWGLISGVFAGVCFQLHYLHFKGRLDAWHSVETLEGIQGLGLMGFISGLAGLAWYIFLDLYEHIPVMPVASSAVISAVWAFMTAKWGLLLIVHARAYIRMFERENPRLIRL